MNLASEIQREATLEPGKGRWRREHTGITQRREVKEGAVSSAKQRKEVQKVSDLATRR